MPSTAAGSAGLQIETAASSTPEEVLDALAARVSGLTAAEVAARTDAFGPNAVRSHHASAWSVLARQLHSPLLWLLLAAAAVSGAVGEGLDAVIIGVIVAASVGLGFVNEFRAERAAEAMHSEIRHEVAATRVGRPVSVEVTHLVPGDIVHLGVGAIVPADLRLLTSSNLECDESILTGESVAAEKAPRPVPGEAPLAELSSCLFAGTVVHSGTADAVVVASPLSLILDSDVPGDLGGVPEAASPSERLHGGLTPRTCRWRPSRGTFGPGLPAVARPP